MLKLWTLLNERKLLIGAAAYGVAKLVESFGVNVPEPVWYFITAWCGVGAGHKVVKGAKARRARRANGLPTPNVPLPGPRT